MNKRLIKVSTESGADPDADLRESSSPYVSDNLTLHMYCSRGLGRLESRHVVDKLTMVSARVLLLFAVGETCVSLAFPLQGGILAILSVPVQTREAKSDGQMARTTYIAEKLRQRDLISLGQQLAVVGRLRDHPGRTITNCVDWSRRGRTGEKGLSWQGQEAGDESQSTGQHVARCKGRVMVAARERLARLDLPFKALQGREVQEAEQSSKVRGSCMACFLFYFAFDISFGRNRNPNN